MQSFLSRLIHNDPIEVNGACPTRYGNNFFEVPINQLVERVLGEGPIASTISNIMKPVWNPDLNIAETDKEYRITMDLPGLSEADVDVRVKDGLLTISGERKEETEEKDQNFYRAERRFGEFTRQIALPEDVKIENIDASFKNGVLTISVPKHEEKAKRARKIDIRAEK
ncbi:MAG: Hsp20/alpha crystallin family protein [Dongiaceae bacterium]